MLHDHFHGALDGADVLLHNLRGVAAELFTANWVAQESFQSLAKAGFILHLPGTVRGEKTSDDVGELGHVWTEHHWFANSRWLNRILPAFGGKAFANENHGR